MSEIIKPPLGLMPKSLHQRITNINRYNDICAAMWRYQSVNKEIPREWIDELNELQPIIDSYNLKEVEYNGQD